MQRDNWAVQQKGMGRGLQTLCVSHERALFSDKYVVLISVCGDRNRCMLSISESQAVCERVCVVCVWPLVRWQSCTASWRYTLSYKVHLIHRYMHTHTTLGGLCWVRQHRGERDERRTMERQGEGEDSEFYHTKENYIFLFFNAQQIRFKDYFM